ncbi:MAG: TPM domain-containing protein [Hydrogenophilales bacterium]|nr:TPM domain-containing protein [Hydrogenophilales bacterium]
MTFLARVARWLFITLLPLALGGLPAVSHAEVVVPPLAARVTDLTQTLSAQQQQALAQKLAAFEAQKGSQIAVLIVPTTKPEEIEQYSIRVAEAWKLGRKGIDDGVLLLIAKEDRALRIEVGYGLEGVIPDIAAKRIIEEIITPRFRSGDFYGGIEQGVERLIGLIKGEALPPPKPSGRAGVDFFENTFPLALFLIFVVGGVLRAIFGRLLGASIAAAVAGVGAWMLIGSLISALIVGALAFFFIVSGSSGIGYGGGRGGGRGGGGLGGGGFSGGGGGFGGGGASGRW